MSFSEDCNNSLEAKGWPWFPQDRLILHETGTKWVIEIQRLEYHAASPCKDRIHGLTLDLLLELRTMEIILLSVAKIEKMLNDVLKLYKKLQ